MSRSEFAGFPSDVTDEEWEFVLPYLLLCRETARSAGTICAGCPTVCATRRVPVGSGVTCRTSTFEFYEERKRAAPYPNAVRAELQERGLVLVDSHHLPTSLHVQN